MVVPVAFEGTLYTCPCELHQVKSSYEGEFKQCPCGSFAVDQTTHYVRFIGGLPKEMKTDSDYNSSINA